MPRLRRVAAAVAFAASLLFAGWSRADEPGDPGKARPPPPIAEKTAKLKKGKHTLLAVVADAAGHHAAAGRVLKTCK